MAISYNKLWKLLIDKGMSAAELRKAAEIAPNTLTRLNKGLSVNMETLERICCVLGVDIGDIMGFVQDKED